MDIKVILSLTATVSTLAQFLSGVFVCLQVKHQGQAGDISGLPFAVGIVSCSFWFKYAMLIGDGTMLLVNFSGVLLQTLYLMFYYRYCVGVVSLSVVRRLSLAVLAIVSFVYYYTDVFETDAAQARFRLGCLAASASIAFSAAPVVSVVEVVRSKSTEVLPLPMIVSTFCVMLQWYLYGILIDDAFVQVPNLIGTCISGLQLPLFLLYPRSRHQNVAGGSSSATRI